MARPIGTVARLLSLLSVAAVGSGFATVGTRADSPQSWPFFGGDLGNTRGQNSSAATANTSRQINPGTAARLALKWAATTPGDVSATPTVEAGGLYFPDYDGYVNKLDPRTGARLWSRPVSGYTGKPAYSRSSPAIGALGEIVIGDNSPNAAPAPGARVVSIDKATGKLNWVAIIDSSPNADVTISPVIYQGRVYAATASNEEALAARVPGFKPTFRGSVVALDEATGRLLWRSYMVPSGYSGAAVWGSSPVVFPAINAVIVTTGNNYSVPASVGSCFKRVGTNLAAQYACMDPTNYVDSVVALDLVTGHPKWGRKFAGADTWTIACVNGPASGCPSPAGQDTDFAAAPNLTWIGGFSGVADDRGGTSRDYILGAGQKSGKYWGINPFNGGLFWSAFLGRGNIMWGSAINTDDHDAAYVALSNTAHYSNLLAGQNGHPITSTGGAWASLNLRNGRINWQLPAYGTDLASAGKAAAAPGPVSFTNRVMFAGATSGYFVGLDATTGGRLWTYNAGGSVIGGPSVYDETLFWGAGASKTGSGSVHRMFAFSIGGH